MAIALPLTRAANLVDFDGICPSAGAWQQRHAVDAYGRWRLARVAPIGDRVATVICNWGAAGFWAPGSATLYTYDHTDWPHAFADESCVTIYACSVLDRIDEPRRFLRQAYAALVQGGLLFATFALWDAHGPDVAIGHELRARIYDRLGWKRLIEEIREIGYATFGGVDLRYPGHTLTDHSLGSLVAIKEPR
jgi:hypothetical protein